MKKYIILLVALLPIPLFAVDFNLAGQTFKSILTYATQQLVIPLFYLLDGLAFLAFFYGLVKFVIKADNEDELKKGKEYMLWGIIALFVLVSFSTILGLISNEFFGKSVNLLNPPLLPKP